jgi:hypothetical protein
MLGVGHSTLGDIDDESERQTLSLFDQWVLSIVSYNEHYQTLYFGSILREEGNGDVFSLRQWRAPTSSESESESEDSDCSAELSEEEDHMDSDFDAARPYVSL